MSISVTLNVVFIIAIASLVALLIFAGGLYHDTQKRVNALFTVLEKYRMYVASINKDYEKARQTCVMIERDRV